MHKFFFILLLLSACAKPIPSQICPTYPIAGKKVADELISLPDSTHTFEWLARLNKLRQELQLCQE